MQPEAAQDLKVEGAVDKGAEEMTAEPLRCSGCNAEIKPGETVWIPDAPKDVHTWYQSCYDKSRQNKEAKP